MTNSRVISQQIVPSNYQYSFYNFLNNFALITVNQVSGQQIIFYETLSIQFFQPAIIIKGQVDQPIQFQITTGPIPIIYKTSLNVKTVNQPQILFSSSTVTIGQKYIGQSYNNSYIYYEDIEQYVYGQNLSQVNLQKNNQNISSLAIIQFEQSSSIYTLQNTSDYLIYNIQQMPYNALLQQFNSSNQYYIYYCNISDLNKLNIQSPMNYTQNSPIDFVDSQGSFTIQSDSSLPQKRIFLPSLDNLNILYINTITVQCDNNQNYFTFSSDITASIVIIQCGSTITSVSYKPSFQSSYQPILINQNVIQQNFPSNSKITTMNGIAFIYSSSYITAYDYINQIIIGSTINLPVLSQLQKVLIFKDSFFIYYSDQSSIPVINQYSYNNFQTSTPILLRSLYNDSQNLPNTQVQPITLYGSSTNQQYLLFQQQSYPNKYMVYRVDRCSSQNQFYGILQLEQSNLNIYSAGKICQLLQTFKCYNILQSAQISIQLQLANTYYQSQVLIPFNFTVSQNEQNQTFNFILRRDTSAVYGLVNQQSSSIQSLKTQIQDSNSSTSSIQTFQLYDGSDPSIFNSNLLGWQLNNSSGSIQNRVQNQTILTQNQNQFKILKNQNLIVDQDQFSIGSLVIISGIDYSNCVGLEDASQTYYKDNSTDLKLYFICQQKLAVYTITLILQNSAYSSFNINSIKIYQLIQDIPYPNIYTNIFSSSSLDIRLFGPFRASTSQLILDEESTQATIYKMNLNSQSIISENIINSFNNLILIFYASGKIVTTYYNNIDPQLNNLYNLKDILLQYNFVISQQDVIAQVLQISDTSFNIQFQLSYIFQVTFTYQENNLSITQVQSYDYLDGFTTMLGYFQAPYNQIFVGQSQNNEIAINCIIKYKTKIAIPQMDIIRIYSTKMLKYLFIALAIQVIINYIAYSYQIRIYIKLIQNKVQIQIYNHNKLNRNSLAYLQYYLL
ncbi:transmembrane protein, putative (macronuclear) [Tetrahymena thermophila SB210]|uniref:Transmembrane protein, putative n=1 Tax=Tetrahymena thermophila (strain SB210) TaxID=312017 RepID=Q237F2_TETTS|nr:transmembrane protein, putative [Tetrahymena thermophila SB210]EAR92789.2 transmembrane protein, putative [Tetrahymena thermophila SB210]|eukprot:XP_001013034.2 transmembrane protein, putative [Tetrahymena thermophila SB210]